MKKEFKIGEIIYSPMCGRAVITDIFKSIREDFEELVYEIQEKVTPEDSLILGTKFLVYEDEIVHELDYDPTSF